MFMRERNLWKYSKGFTLIEVLVSLAILSTLFLGVGFLFAKSQTQTTQRDFYYSFEQHQLKHRLGKGQLALYQMYFNREEAQAMLSTEEAQKETIYEKLGQAISTTGHLIPVEECEETYGEESCLKRVGIIIQRLSYTPQENTAVDFYGIYEVTLLGIEKKNTGGYVEFERKTYHLPAH